MDDLDYLKPILGEARLDLTSKLPGYLFYALVVGWVVYVCSRPPPPKAQPAKPKKNNLEKPTKVPYSIPFYGHASWLNKSAAGLWQKVKQYDSPAKVITLVIWGRRFHIVRDVALASRISKMSSRFDNMLPLRNVFALESGDEEKLENHHFELQELYHHCLGDQAHIGEMATQFRLRLQHDLAAQPHDTQIQLGPWVEKLVFDACQQGVFGKGLLEACPTLMEDIGVIVKQSSGLLVGKPSFMFPGVTYRARNRLLDGLNRWRSKSSTPQKKLPSSAVKSLSKPLGSRMLQAQYQWCQYRGLSTRAVAALDLALIAAISKDIVPTVAWMLMHIIAPQDGNDTILSRVTKEVECVQAEDGTFAMPRLMASPLLNSIYLEVLRTYSNSPMIRELEEPVKIPLDDERRMKLSKGFVVCPPWLYHHDRNNFSHPPADRFVAERFLRRDSVTGKSTFCTTDSGQMFAYGAGEAICPGRGISKQEVFIAVAAILSEFEFESPGYSDTCGNKSNVFPEAACTVNHNAMLSPGGDVKVRIQRKDRDYMFKVSEPSTRRSSEDSQ